MKKKFGVIADDMTGAMDAGIQLLKEGIKAGVIFDSSYIDEMSQRVDVVVADTESRNVESQLAYQSVKNFISAFKDKGLNFIYKKVDSTLRGNIGSELNAVMDTGDIDLILMAPALPFNGRTTLEGYHYVNGVKLEYTELAHDPFAPVPYSYIPDIINMQSARKVAVIPISVVREGEKALKQAVEAACARGYEIAAVDAIKNDDLDTIAKVSGGLDNAKALLCGSAGLFQQIGGIILQQCCDGNMDRQAERLSSASHDKPVVVISGTPALMTKAQIAYVRENMDDVEVFKIDVLTDIEDILRQIADALDKGKNIIIDGAGEGKEKLLDKYSGDRVALVEESNKILNMLAGLAKKIIDRFYIGGMVLLGGDTAISVSRILDIQGIELIEEVEPYVPSGMMLFEDGNRYMPVVTKAGGFGRQDTLKNIIEYFSKRFFI